MNKIINGEQTRQLLFAFLDKIFKTVNDLQI